MSLWGALLGGCHFVLHAAGWLEGGLTASFEKFILDVEMLQMFAELFQPVPASAEEIGIEAVAEVGPGGHFFAAAHTMQRYRDAFYTPLVSDWRNFGAWSEAGAKTATERAAERVARHARRLSAAAHGRRRCRKRSTRSSSAAAARAARRPWPETQRAPRVRCARSRSADPQHDLAEHVPGRQCARCALAASASGYSAAIGTLSFAATIASFRRCELLRSGDRVVADDADAGARLGLGIAHRSDKPPALPAAAHRGSARAHRHRRAPAPHRPPREQTRVRRPRCRRGVRRRPHRPRAV